MITKEWFKSNKYKQYIDWKIIFEIDYHNWRLGFSYYPLKSNGSYRCCFREKSVAHSRRGAKIYFLCLTIEWINIKEYE